MQVSLPALKVFESAARLGSFKAAASELSISPTAVSHHIKNLEHRLNVALFVRATRHVSLTECGKELAAATSKGFATIEAAIDKISAKGSQVDITATSSFAALVLVPALNTFSSLHPEIKVNITSGESIDPNSFALPIRYGDERKQAKEDIIARDHFNLYCSPTTANTFHKTPKPRIYTTQWKNEALPSVPLRAWLERNQLQEAELNVTFFDQELFGIQQALQQNAFVFCSSTLTQGYVKSGILCELNTLPVSSALCYYIKDKVEKTTRHTFVFVEWLELLLNPNRHSS
ncbi:LysR family transcriptional regulator [Alteromonas sediminis]|uniref:LysR family transcriptional regulator n=1 Tax=Alteromonas sediminis TaxID=2259342 RepID=A0A3N5Y1U8_9ALTE|nr:LysR family transcriptional regulator [Alteromonas sediminis]RPJ66556.1 LysR family transcriptional regulator [Alteromonas sediminis]